MRTLYGTRTLDQSQPTRRSKVFVVACKAQDLTGKLVWLMTLHGDKTIGEIVGEQPEDRKLCPVCKADMVNWSEVFHEPHYCKSNNKERN